MSAKLEKFGSARNLVEIIAILIAGGWVAWVFVWEARIVPARLPPNLSTQISVRENGREKQLSAMEMSIEFENLSGRPINILKSLYRVYGSTINRTDNDDEEVAAQTRETFEGETGRDRSKRHWEKKNTVLLAVGKVVTSDNFWLESNERTTRQVAFFVPCDDYDLLRVMVDTYLVPRPSDLRAEWVVNADSSVRVEFYNSRKPEEAIALDSSSADDQEILKDERLSYVSETYEYSLWGQR